MFYCPPFLDPVNLPAMSLLLLLRFLHLTSLMLVFGACMFRPLLLIHADRHPRVRNLLDPLVCLLAALALISGVGWLFATAYEVSGTVDMSRVRDLLGQGLFGKVWMLHLMCCIAVLVCLRIPNPRLQVVARPLSALALATLAPVAQHALEGSMGQWLVINQLLHLLSLGAWCGGLMVLLFMLGALGVEQAQPLRARFHDVGAVLLAVAVASAAIGLWAWTHAASVPAQGANITAALATELAVLVAMLMLALHQRRLANAPFDATAARQAVTLQWACALVAVAALCVVGALAPAVLG